MFSFTSARLLLFVDEADAFLRKRSTVSQILFVTLVHMVHIGKILYNTHHFSLIAHSFYFVFVF